MNLLSMIKLGYILGFLSENGTSESRFTTHNRHSAMPTSTLIVDFTTLRSEYGHPMSTPTGQKGSGRNHTDQTKLETTPTDEMEPETTPTGEMEPETTPTNQMEPETTPTNQTDPKTTTDRTEPETTPTDQTEPETTPTDQTDPETTPTDRTKPQSTVTEHTGSETTAGSSSTSEIPATDNPGPQRKMMVGLVIGFSVIIVGITAFAVFSRKNPRPQNTDTERLFSSQMA